MTPAAAEVRWPARVVYGEPPTGFQSERGPEPLVPGCYQAAILGTGGVQFMIDLDGGVREVPFVM